jgi:hypothetical protein
MIKMQVREKNISDIGAVKAEAFKRFVEGSIAVQEIVREELLTLLIPYSGIDKREALAIFNQQAAHSHIDEVVAISRICLLPDTLGHHAKHGAAVELEMTGFDGVKFHGAKILHR